MGLLLCSRYILFVKYVFFHRFWRLIEWWAEDLPLQLAIRRINPSKSKPDFPPFSLYSKPVQIINQLLVVQQGNVQRQSQIFGRFGISLVWYGTSIFTGVIFRSRRRFLHGFISDRMRIKFALNGNVFFLIRQIHKITRMLLFFYQRNAFRNRREKVRHIRTFSSGWAQSEFFAWKNRKFLTKNNIFTNILLFRS